MKLYLSIFHVERKITKYNILSFLPNINKGNVIFDKISNHCAIVLLILNFPIKYQPD